jgi:HEAT repeat protein
LPAAAASGGLARRRNGAAIAAFIAAQGAKDGAMPSVLSRLAVRACAFRTSLMWAAVMPLLAPLAGWSVEEPKLEGVDVIQTVRDLTAPVTTPHSKVAKGKPWEGDIAALTDARPEQFNPAMAALIRHGAEVIPDLTALAADQDWRIRGRVVQVAAGIGGDGGTGLVLMLSRDTEKQVRELAAFSLGMAGGKGAFERLAQLLGAGDPIIREAAARGLSTLGDARGLGLLCGYAREHDDVVQRQMHAGLAELALRVTSVPALIELLQVRQGDELAALVDATFPIGDPRLCPALAALLISGDERVALFAARALSANGDSRALGRLCALAANGAHAELRSTAAETLRQLTGYPAAPGPAWSLWWTTHQPEIEELSRRDAYIAALHDPLHVVTRAELSGYTVEQLAPLIDGALESGKRWWPARAYLVLATDAGARWTVSLLARIAAAQDSNQRLALIILLDQLGDPAAAAGLGALLDEDLKQPPQALLANGAERVALDVALQRRGVIRP